MKRMAAAARGSPSFAVTRREAFLRLLPRPRRGSFFISRPCRNNTPEVPPFLLLPPRQVALAPIRVRESAPAVTRLLEARKLKSREFKSRGLSRSIYLSRIRPSPRSELRELISSRETSAFGALRQTELIPGNEYTGSN